MPFAVGDSDGTAPDRSSLAKENSNGNGIKWAIPTTCSPMPSAPWVPVPMGACDRHFLADVIDSRFCACSNDPGSGDHRQRRRRRVGPECPSAGQPSPRAGRSRSSWVGCEPPCGCAITSAPRRNPWGTRTSKRRGSTPRC
jgi:hypothetical protein